MFWLLRTIFALSLLVIIPTNSWAVRLLTTGFEENCTTTCMWSSVVGGAGSIVTTTPHSGTYRFDTSSASGNSGLKYLRVGTSGTGVTLSARTYWQSSTAAPSATVQILNDASSGSVVGMKVSLLITTGVFRLTNVITGTTADSAMNISANTLYRLETQHLLSDTVGTMTLRIYDTANPATLLETVTITGEDTLPTNIQAMSFAKDATTAVFSYDDIAWNDSTGSFQTSWAGPGKVYLLVPDSNVAMQWEDSAGTADSATFANVDDLPGAPNDADYNAADTTLDALDALGNIDQMGLTNPWAEVTSDATITVVDVYGRIGSNQTSATHLRFKLWDDASALTNGPTVTANVNGWRIVNETEHLVFDATGKTKANLNTFNVGYEDITDTIVARPRRVSALWANVEWTEAASVTVNKRGSLVGVLP